MGGAVVERRPPSSSHIQHKSGNPKAKGNGWGAKGGDSMVVDSVGKGGGGGRKGEEKGRIGMGAATQTGASSWGVGGGQQQQQQQGGQGGAPQRRVLFHPAHNKGSLASSQQQQQHSGALLRPLNAPMAGCSNGNNGGGGGNNNNGNGGNSNSRAGPSGSPSSQHESLNWAPVSRIVSAFCLRP